MIQILFLFLITFIESSNEASNLLPIVVWHGLGDDCCSDKGMKKFIKTLQAATQRPVYTIRIGKNAQEDRWNSLFGDANEQVVQVCADLRRIEALKSGFDAVGISQGGQLLRAYVERCNTPPVRRLITIGSQHYGVISPPGCLIDEDKDEVRAEWELKYPKCDWWKRLLTSPFIIYSTSVQRNVLPAQYYRDPKHLGLYLSRNHFLADINNERGIKRLQYKLNVMSLEKFVMYKFEEDRVVVPPESSWFGHVDENRNLIRMRDSALYNEDWIGLRELDAAGKLVESTIAGPHMNITTKFITEELANQLSA